jgi:hypothetical protein
MTAQDKMARVLTAETIALARVGRILFSPDK